MTLNAERRPLGGGGAEAGEATASVPRASDSAPATRHPARPTGWGFCGCEDPRRHEPGCLADLDRRHADRDRDALFLVQRELVDLRRQVDPTRTRQGCCVFCFGPLDPEAIRARDNRCTACFRAFGAFLGQRRRQQWEAQP